MGTFFHPITLLADNGDRETLEGLVDTGSSFSTVPRSVLEKLGVVPIATVRLRLATGAPAQAEIGEVRAEIDGLGARTIICVFGEPEAPTIIGAHTLEAFLVGVDPDQRRLVPLDGWWA